MGLLSLVHSLAKPVDKYGLLFDYRTVYAFKYVVYHQSLERLLYRLFFRQNSNHFCMSGRQQYGAGSRGQGRQGGQGSSRAGTGIDPPKGILIVLKKGCDWTKKCMAVYHQYIDISDNFLCCAMYKYSGRHHESANISFCATFHLSNVFPAKIISNPFSM